MKNQNQNGSALAVITIVLVVIILGTLGFVLWQNFLKTKPADSKTAQQTSNTSHMSKPIENVVKIPEMGISFVVPDSLKDITYTYSSTNQPTKVGEPNIIVGTASFSTKTLTNSYPDCSSDSTAPPLGGVTKITGTYGDGVLGPTWSGGGVVKQFSDSFLTFAHAQAACFFNTAGNDQSVVNGINSQFDALNDALKNANQI
jgi:hypothetical protein